MTNYANQANRDVRTAAAAAGICLWEIAEVLGVTRQHVFSKAPPGTA